MAKYHREGHMRDERMVELVKNHIDISISHDLSDWSNVDCRVYSETTADGYDLFVVTQAKGLGHDIVDVVAVIILIGVVDARHYPDFIVAGPIGIGFIERVLQVLVGCTPGLPVTACACVCIYVDDGGIGQRGSGTVHDHQSQGEGRQTQSNHHQDRSG